MKSSRVRLVALAFAVALAALWEFRRVRGAALDAGVAFGEARAGEAWSRSLERRRAALSAALESAVARARERGAGEGAALLSASGLDGVEVEEWLDRQRAAIGRDAAEQAADWMAEFLPPDSAPPPREDGSGEGIPAAPGWIFSAAVLAAAALALWDYRSNFRTPLLRLAERLARSGKGLGLPGSRSSDPLVKLLEEACDRTRDALAAVQRDLERLVEAKTAALGQALLEQRETNQRLEGVLRELEETQEELLEQRKMAALGTLAGGVAHEFHNILGGIRGCAEDLLRDVRDEDSRETLNVVIRAAIRGREIVDGLRRFSGQRERPGMERGDLLSAVREAARLAAGQAEAAGVAIEVRGEPLEVVAPLSGLHQVFLNLLGNAIAASPAGSRVEAVVFLRDGLPCVEIRDRGCGVRPEDENRIFEPFYTTRQESGGTGLGLAISHGIVSDAGGRLAFERREGGGSTFRIEIPPGPGAETTP